MAESIYAAGTVVSVSKTDTGSVQLNVNIGGTRSYTVVPANQVDQKYLAEIGDSLDGQTVMFGGYLRPAHDSVDIVLAQTIGIDLEPSL